MGLKHLITKGADGLLTPEMEEDLKKYYSNILNLSGNDRDSLKRKMLLLDEMHQNRIMEKFSILEKSKIASREWNNDPISNFEKLDIIEKHIDIQRIIPSPFPNQPIPEPSIFIEGGSSIDQNQPKPSKSTIENIIEEQNKLKNINPPVEDLKTPENPIPPQPVVEAEQPPKKAERKLRGTFI